ncbi:transporter substrate-binding domain-containing protein [uncultured Aquitalea sp.]|uniref:transporter substrate-binding domain-containing protein n=1 Tax=uncultured Aquitalea sp. TaxID=540272 RepID=UPI0025E58923|nr:transporter substrate-binding domain-containing protein [uncultured Aquitalea sp.]
MRFWGLLALLLAWLSSPAMAEEGLPVSLRSQALTGDKFDLGRDDRLWLKVGAPLRVGFVHSPPPFEMYMARVELQGINVDIVGYLQNALQLTVDARHYQSVEDAAQALRQGKLDALIGISSAAARPPGLALTRPYLLHQQVLVGRDADSKPYHANIALQRGEPVPGWLRQRYPNAVYTPFENLADALVSVVAGQQDLLLGDATSINYLSNQNMVDGLKVVSYRPPDDGWAMAVGSGQSGLLRVLNAALGALPQEAKEGLLRRWSGGAPLLLPEAIPVRLTPDEKAWLAKHKVLRLAAGHSRAPITFYDSNGQLRGIAADLLTLISQRTGMQVEVRKTNTLPSIRDMLQRGEADMAVLPFDPEKSDGLLRYSRAIAFMNSQLVIRENADQPQRTRDLAGKSIAVSRGNDLSTGMKGVFPDAKFIEVDNPLSAFDLVENGKVDAAIVSSIHSRYYLPTLFNGKLREVPLPGMPTGQLAFATSASNPLLLSILDKALASIGPEEMSIIINERWRTNVSASNQSWRDYSRVIIYLVICVASMLLLVSLAWNSRLRKQIDKRHEAEKALSDQLNFMSTLIHVTPYPVYVRDRQGYLLSCNEPYLQAVGLGREQALGQEQFIRQIVDIDQETRVSLEEDYRQAIEYGVSIQCDRQVVLKGRPICVYHWIQPFRDSENIIRGVICGWIDISERLRLLEESRQAKEEADRANQAKTTFLATMSHEIRTPMSAVIGMLELALRQAEAGKADHASIQVAYDSAKGLLGLIGDILDIVRIESGHLSLNPENANLRDLIHSVARVFDGLARQKGLSLQVDIRDDTAAAWQAMVDPLRFKQVLSNLLSNAIKFTERGSVIIEADVIADGETHQCRLAVVDTGIGIRDEDQLRLFQPFGQVGGPSVNTQSGTGLGLAISRTLCEMMQGSLHMESRYGIGTRLSAVLRLPAAVAPRLMEARLPGASLPKRDKKSLRILVVDDNSANRMLLSQQLDYLGHQSAAAADAREALELWEEGGFDMIITDCNMPGMTGYQLASAIREAEELSGLASCHILGFTANALPDERERCISAGMDDCLFKPIDLSALDAYLTGLPGDAASPRLAEEGRVFSLASLGFMDGERQVGLLTQLVQGFEQDMAALRQALAATDADNAKRLAHQIKGAARIIAAESAAQCCCLLEARCLTGKAVSPGMAEMTALTLAMDSLLLGLEEELGRLTDEAVMIGR